MVYKVMVLFDSDDKYVEDQFVGIYTTEDKAKEAIKQAIKRIKEEGIDEVIDVQMYPIELDKNYWM